MLFFVLGILLWVVIGYYLIQHPGERASLIPSLEMLSQKVQGVWFRIIGKDPDTIKIKSSLEKNFDELAYLVDNSTGCVSPDLVTKLQNYRDEVWKLSYDDIPAQQYLYYTRAVEIKWEIEEKCK